MPQQFLHDFEFRTHASQQRRIRVAKRMPADTFLDSDSLRNRTAILFQELRYVRQDGQDQFRGAYTKIAASCLSFAGAATKYRSSSDDQNDVPAPERVEIFPRVS